MESSTAIEQVYEFRRSRLEHAFEILARPKFQKKLQNRITKPTFLFIDGYEFEYPAELPLDVKKQNNWAISHKLDCPQFESPLAGVGGYQFEADKRFYELSKEAAQLVWSESQLARELMQRHQGLWVVALEDLWRRLKDKPFVGTKPALTPKFEMLLPGFEAWLDKQFKAEHPQIVEKNRSGYSERQKRESTYFIRTKLMEMALAFISDLQDDCKHGLSVHCLMCERQMHPNLRASVEWRFPRDLCYRCVSVSDYHRVALMEEGLDQELARQAQVEAVQAISNLSHHQLWELLPADSYMNHALDLASRPKPEQITLLKYLAALSVNNLWDTKYHLLAAAGLEELIPRGRSRGIRSISSCGHLCLSEGERSICEELMRRGIPHSREPIYWELIGASAPNAREVFGEMRGDFLVGKTVLEFAGMYGQSAYDQKINEKIRLCKVHGIDMHVLYPDDLKTLPTRLDDLGLKAKG